MGHGRDGQRVMKYRVHYTPVGTANIRKNPSTNSEIVGIIREGDVVDLHERQDDGWVKITFKDATGWTFNKVQYRKISFDNISDGYDYPVGTEEERHGIDIPPKTWYNASPFGRLYFVGTKNEAYHTGLDLNQERNLDAGKAFYSTANGVVTFARDVPSWGQLLIIRNFPLENGIETFARYAHMEKTFVKVGDIVSRGDSLGTIGDANGRYSHHLHFDLSVTTLLLHQPTHWPKKDYEELRRHYVDPDVFIRNNRPSRKEKTELRG